jgi:DNA polymerase elongation subunit (family B)
MAEIGSFRLFDFQVRDEVAGTSGSGSSGSSSGSATHKQFSKDKKCFTMQMFGINERGDTACIIVRDYQPFFYVKVPEAWGFEAKSHFIADLKKAVGKFSEDSILTDECKLLRRKALYGFDGGKDHKFLMLKFKNMATMNKAKNLWYNRKGDEMRLHPHGYNNTRIYEANIPPLLRYFHIKDISPSGWVKIKGDPVETQTQKQTACRHEYHVGHKCVVPQPEKETLVPYKIMSFDIEASSSHGDFPIPVKTYKKLAANIVDACLKEPAAATKSEVQRMVRTAFHDPLKGRPLFTLHDDIERIYPKTAPGTQLMDAMFERMWSTPIQALIDEADPETLKNANTIESMFEKLKADAEAAANADAEEEDGDADAEGNDDAKSVFTTNTWTKPSLIPPITISSGVAVKDKSIADMLQSSALDRETKITHMNDALLAVFPPVEGDKVTFIGSTFLRYGEARPYLNHCLALGTCDPVPGADIVSCKTERALLQAWTALVQREDPDIIIGYNIFGFDYNFMFHRAQENHVEDDFLKLSRNVDEFCGKRDFKTGRVSIEETSIALASGQYDLHYIAMPGRLQIDMYNYFRRDYNLTSYKLDYVGAYFIGDDVLRLEHHAESDSEVTRTRIFSKNLAGLEVGNYIELEETGHSTDPYKDGQKFQVLAVNPEAGHFEIVGHETPDLKKHVRWGVSKDDVTPQDIFRMTNEGPGPRAVIAKYCIQDCNLVHHLMNKVDVITGYNEMAKICSVPISFLVIRGQGIKLTSYMAKKCREKNTLMPVIDKGPSGEGYEGAIVLPPKRGLYLDNPVACNDYSSLYPSSMISENLSHDSKVWTKEYDLDGRMVRETGEKDPKTGQHVYDNLPGYGYVDVEYDTYRWKPNPRVCVCGRRIVTDGIVVCDCGKRIVGGGKMEKHLSGKKVCRFAQFKHGSKAILPSILEELLAARKATRKLAEQQSDPFMANVLDKRQLAYKVTANSLYGQCGAKTSTFYEVDVAASTTATGRKLLTYAKRMVEEVYGDAECQTSKYGIVHTRAEYVYGDSVAAHTPVYVRLSGVIDVCPIEALAEKYGNSDNWTQCKEEGKQTKEVCEMMCGVETWSEKGWTRLHRVIRHALAPHKKMMRIVTHTGIVDVTDDHSLILANGEEISPKNVEIGTKLLHSALPQPTNDTTAPMVTTLTVEQARVMGFFFGDGSCGDYHCESGNKCSWALNNASMEFVQKYLELCKIAYPDLEWVYNDTLKSSGVYKITPKSKKYGSIAEFVRTYRSMMYYKQCKIIPTSILNGTREVRESFWNGMYDADGDKDKHGYTRIDQKNQISAACICLLAQSLGWKTSLNTRSDKMDIYRATMTTRVQRKCTDSIKKIVTLPFPAEENTHVYDLTTDNHHFAAGIGNMIVHNTDSVFYTFNLTHTDGTPIRGKQALEITIELARQVGDMASAFLKAPHGWVYEKTLMPFGLLQKKRYFGILYETDPNKGKPKSMGIVLRRRDNAPIVKDVYGGLIDILTKQQDLEAAINFVRESLQSLVDERVPMDKLIITKSLRSTYKNPQQIAHKVLADRMGKRDPGNKPSSGDRIPFVYIHNADKKALQGERIETPDYIRAKRLKPNYSFYITNQIMKPVAQLFGLVLEQMAAFRRKKARFLEELESVRSNWSDSDDKLQKKLDDLRFREVKELIFDEYLRQADNLAKSNKSITEFFKAKK